MFNSLPAIVSAASGGSGSGYFVGYDYIATNGTSYTCPVPIDVQDGDVMIALVAFYTATFVNTNHAGDSAIVSSPAGWTSVGESPYTFLSSSGWEERTLGVQYRVANSEPTNYTWTKALAGDYYSAVSIHVFRGISHDPIDFINVLDGQSSLTENSTIYAGVDTGSSVLYMCGFTYGPQGYDHLGGTASNLEPSVGSPATTYTEHANILVGPNRTNHFVQTAPATGAGAVSAELNLIESVSAPSRTNQRVMIGLKPFTSFTWGETFPDLPSTGIELADWLGIDGSVSTDLGDSVTHFAVLDRTTPWEIGSQRDVSSANGGEMGISAGTSIASDPDFWASATYQHPVAEFTTINDNATLDMQYGPYQDAPSVADGTLSFMYGGVFRVDDSGIAGSNVRYVLHSRSTTAPYPGWNLTTDNNSPKRLISRITWADGTANQVNLDNAFEFGVPFVCFVVFDFFHNEQRVYSSGLGAGQTVGVTQALTVPASTFHQTQRDITVGSFNFGSNEGYIGKCAIIWTAEWDASIDDGLSAANIEQFLKKSDGYLPLATPQNRPVITGGNPGSLDRCWRNPSSGSPYHLPGLLYRDRWTFSNIASLNDSGDFTIEYWMYVDSGGAHTHCCAVCTVVPTVTTNGWSARIDYAGISGTGLAQFRSVLGTGNEISPRPPDDEWHHIAFVRSGANMQNYYDGVANGSSYAYSGAITAGGYPLILGGAPHQSYDSQMHRIADVRIWNTARTGTEISNNYQTALVGNETGLIAYWPLQSNGFDYGPNGYHLDNLGGGEFMASGNGPV